MLTEPRTQQARSAGCVCSAFLLVLGAFTAFPVAAHKLTDCVHKHFISASGKKLAGNRCNPSNVACAVTAGATCKTVNTGLASFDRDCQCRSNSGGGCFAVGSQNLITSGVPGAFDTKLYSTEISDVSESSVFAGSGLFQVFPVGSVAVDGTVLLTYGSFADPANVPVTIDDVTLTFPSLTVGGFETGEHFVSLAAGGTQTMNYDSTTGILSPSGDAILVDIANSLGEVPDVPVYLQAEIDLDSKGDGPARLYGQLTTPLPDGLEGLIFLSGFENGDISYWSVLPLPAVGMAGGALLAGLFGILRRRRRRSD